MSTKRKRPAENRGLSRGKDSGSDVGPADQREGSALQFVLQYAPPDADWEIVCEVYEKGLDPREVWADDE